MSEQVTFLCKKCRSNRHTLANKRLSICSEFFSSTSSSSSSAFGPPTVGISATIKPFFESLHRESPISKHDTGQLAPLAPLDIRYFPYAKAAAHSAPSPILGAFSHQQRSVRDQQQDIHASRPLRKLVIFSARQKYFLQALMCWPAPSLQQHCRSSERTHTKGLLQRNVTNIAVGAEATKTEAPHACKRPMI